MTLLKSNAFVEANRNMVNLEFRNKFHLMAPIGWMNDPNGFIFFRGQYHLFYQYYPYDSVWGPMHWGHSVSDDCITWEELPTALEPDQDYDKDGCFSGTAYVENDVLYLMYTGHVVENDVVRQVQCLAKSTDGIHFEKFKENPVINESHILGVCSINDFRDPKLFKRNDIYYSLLATKTHDNRGQFVIFTSKDMINWSNAHVFLEGDNTQGIMWECPDLFEIDGKDVIIMSPIQMKAQNHKFTNVSSTLAMIGRVDWKKLEFILENTHEIDSGLDFYAPQSVLNDKGERFMTAWMQMWDRDIISHTLGHKWAGSMTFPRQVNIKNNRLVQKPISTLKNRLDLQTFKIEDSKEYSKIADNPQYVQLESDVPSFEIRMAQDEDEYVSLSFKNHELTLCRKNAGYKIVGNEGDNYTSRTIELSDNKINLEILIDTSSVEVFVNSEETMTLTFYKKKKKREFSVHGLKVNSMVKVGNLR